MYQKHSDRDPVGAVVTALVGAGAATSFAVARGQSPWVAMGITVFAATVALICDRLGWLQS